MAKRKSDKISMRPLKRAKAQRPAVQPKDTSDLSPDVVIGEGEKQNGGSIDLPTPKSPFEIISTTRKAQNGDVFDSPVPKKAADNATTRRARAAPSDKKFDPMEPPGAPLRKMFDRWSRKAVSQDESPSREDRLGWRVPKSTGNISHPSVKPEMVKRLTDLFRSRASKEKTGSKSGLKLLKELGEEEGKKNMADK